ncbi:MAG: ATP-binding protein [Gemmatimonadales bacterium]|jgi:PAS domain S-box-containing protein|nr:ATP-binding protein [Gemmatimonadales bacterium]
MPQAIPLDPVLPPAAATPEVESRSAPRQRAILTGIFAARIVLALGMLLAAALASTNDPYGSFLRAVAVLLVVIATGYGFWRVRLAEGSLSQAFLMGQALADLALVATLVHYAAAPAIFGSLFVLVIAAYAVLMLPTTAATVAALATLLYVADALWFRGGHRVDTAFWVQVALFWVVFAIVAVLGQRLRRADAEQITLEGQLRRVRLEADDILQNIRSGVITVDSDGRLAFINPTAERLLGLDATALVGRPVLDELGGRSQELRQAIVQGIGEGRKVSRGEGMVRGRGRTFPIGLSTTTFRQEDRTAPSVTAIFTDISDHKNLQELHLRAERLEAVAALSASLAHEIKNPLASIRSSCEQLARARQASEDDKVLAGLIVRESDRLSRLLSEFLDFSRVRAARLEPVDLLDVVRASVGMVRAHPDAGSCAEIRVEGESLRIPGDEDLLHRVVANLVLNAVQAGRGDAIHVVVRCEPVAASELPAGAEFESGARLTVRDDGPGIPEEIRDRLFQPFVSRRPGGTGLGLAIVQRAVEAHRGLLFVDSAAGRGTTFTILLPATTLAEDAA